MINNVNDLLGNKGAYLKTKAFGLVFMWTGHLIESGWVFFNKQTNKKGQTITFFTKIPFKTDTKTLFRITWTRVLITFFLQDGVLIRTRCSNKFWAINQSFSVNN